MSDNVKVLTVDELEAKMSAARTILETKVGEYNRKRLDNDMRACESVMDEIVKAEKDYASIAKAKVYTVCANSANPELAACKTRFYYVVGHKEVKEDGKFVKLEVTEQKVRELDLEDFIGNALKKSTEFRFMVQKLNYLLALRVAESLHFTEDQTKQIANCWAMDKLAHDKFAGIKVDSNAKIQACLQEIVDGILFVDNGKGKNVYRVLTHDAAYVRETYSRRQGICGVKLPGNGQMMSLIADVLYRMTNNEVSYTGKFKVMDTSK